MKKLSLILAVLMCVGAVTACAAPQAAAPAAAPAPAPAAAPAAEPAAAPAAEDPMKLGWCMTSLSNVFLADVTDAAEKLCKENNIEIVIGDANGSVTKQIELVENMAAVGCDVIMCLAIDPDTLATTYKNAIADGSKIFSWDSPAEGASVNYVIDNEALGKAVAEEAMEWKDKVYGADTNVQVAIMQGGEEIVHVQRAAGIADGLKEFGPECEVVGSYAGGTVTECMAAAENFMQANPEIKVICCIGDSLAVAANEVLLSMNYDPSSVGVFSVDATDEASAAIAKEQFIKSSFALGNAQYCADEVVNYCIEIMNGVYDAEPLTYYRPFWPITSENVGEWLGE